MPRKIVKALTIIAMLLFIKENGYTQNTRTNSKNKNPMTVEEIKLASIGEWQSIAPEIRPGAQKNADGTSKPLYLTRQFKYEKGDQFELIVTSFADPYGKVALAKMTIKGHIVWQGPHPIADGAQKVDFTADEAYTVTPLVTGFADLLNEYTKGYEQWQVNKPQSILGKAFPPFGLAEGQIFKEFDLIYISHDMMFWGARHFDGRGFDTDKNRPSNLQIPLVRK